MGTNNICPDKVPVHVVDKKFTACNPKTTELRDCELIGVCVVIRSNTVRILFGYGFNVCLSNPRAASLRLEMISHE